MSSLYFLPLPSLVLLIMALAAAVLLQTQTLVYGFFGLNYGRKNLAVSLLDGAILGQLVLLLVCSAQAIYHIGNGFFSVHPFCLLRVLLFFLLLVLSLVLALLRRDILPLNVPAAAALTLPAVERSVGDAFPILLAIAVGFWLFRALRQIIIRAGQRREKLSAYSIKEAVDSLDFGLLFSRADGFSKGEILLCNSKMQELMSVLTGRQLYNGGEFYRLLLQQAVLPGCKKDPQVEDTPIYHLPDGRTWEFSRQSVSVKGMKCDLLTASDVTPYQQASHHLYVHRKQLEQRNRELKEMLQNLEDACRAEELIHIKGRVHDLLGQRISLLLRSLREHRHPDEELLASFADGLPRELKEMPSDREYTLNMLVKDFRSLGVSVHVEGRLPQEEALQKALFEIALEAITNAVRHGYATEIFVTVSHEEGRYTLTVTDNGIPKDEPILEGGGFAGMRRKSAALGGSFRYETTPQFTVSVTLPEGGAL